MSTHAFPHYPREAMLYAVVPTYVRIPDSITATATEIVLTFTPDLTAGEAGKLGTLVRYGRAETTLTLDEYAALEGALSDLRAQRTRTDAQWNALTAAQRDAQLIAWCRDITDVLRALLRD